MPEPESAGPPRREFSTLRVERRGPVGWLVFDRPEAGNAMNARMMEELERAWRKLDDDPEVRVIVNTGTVSSLRLRGNTRPCYNVVEINGAHVDVWRKYPFHGSERIIQFSTDTLSFEKYTARIESEVTSKS